MLVDCQVIDAAKIWNAYCEALSEDIAYAQKKRYRLANLQITNAQIESLALLEVENLLQKQGTSLKDFRGMPVPLEEDLHQIGNRLISEELDYDREEQLAIHMQSLSLLNPDQMVAYDSIIDSVENNKGKLFFIQGRGGTGKTFLWNTIVTKLRSEGKIFLPVVTSGIAALLLPNGRTVHSRFHIPLNPTAESTCDIRHGTNLAGLLQKTSLIIWDEASMANRLCFEALDRTLCDILQSQYENGSETLFGGLTVVCGGDFRKILPVITRGSRTDIIDAALNSSYLWSSFHLYELSQNMCLLQNDDNEEHVAQIIAFDNLLQIGNDSHYECARDEVIQIPNSMSPVAEPTKISSLIDSVYPSFISRNTDHAYLAERAILTPKNDMVKVVNDHILDMIPGEAKSYFSSDIVCKSTGIANDDDSLYPVEFLNSLTFNGVPSHHIQLKVGSAVMLLRNLNQAEGLCNGTRLVVTELEIGPFEGQFY